MSGIYIEGLRRVSSGQQCFIFSERRHPRFGYEKGRGFSRAETKKAHLSMSLSFACLQGEAFARESQSK